MDSKIRKAQKQVLDVFAKKAKGFALAGGTALELFYLHHRFSVDLDFFSPSYDLSEIENLISSFKKKVNGKIKLESEFVAGGRARVRFYTLPVQGSDRPLKIDFVEEVLIKNPRIKKINGVRVYSAENIYFQKIAAISGIRPDVDDIGREVLEGRNEARDVYDVYMLSKKSEPLHQFLGNAPSQWQRGMVHWYRTFSRQDLKLALLDLDIYDPKFNSRNMIQYLENEIKLFTKGILHE